ncbi:MAG TPA: hypothetical protein VFV72_13610 [Candidatus Limnocylindrales bacterium]|nr:hypothetical protein [Candidatus Limnocylindrales bacterium]
MNRARVRRLVATVTVGSLLAIQALAGPASAAPPNWAMTVTPLPAAVSPGQAAGFEVTVTNNGPSNIAALYLNDSLMNVTPVYLLSADRPGACGETGTVASGPLFCSFGALTDHQSVTIVVAYDTTGSNASFPITFQANTTGATFSDGPKRKSHGDTLTKAVSTALSTNKNFAGLFSTTTGTGVTNDTNLSGNNKQATGVQGLPPGMQATVEDGPGTTGTCTSGGPVPCNALFGEWSVVNVNDGDDVAGGFIVTIKFKNGTPTGFLHSYGDPVVQELISPCAGNLPPATLAAYPCFTWNAATATASIYTLHNGSFKGR